jgi:Zn finger protein HypA/HybF involved in hydrogenase expression
MHEYGLAHDIAGQVKAEAQRAGARRIVAVDIEVGGLSHSSAEHLSFWVREALKEGPAGEATVRVVKALPFLSCPECRRRSQPSPSADEEWDAYSLPTQCPHCGSTLVQLEGDTGCVIRRLELEQ